MSNGISDVYTGASDFGKFTAGLGGAIGALIGLIIIGIGIYFMVEGSKRTNFVSGEIIESTCPFEPLIIEEDFILQGARNEPSLQGAQPSLQGAPTDPLTQAFTSTASSTSSTGSTGPFCDITVEWLGNPNQTCKDEFTVDTEKKFGLGNNVLIYFDPKDPCNTGSLDSQAESSRIGIILIVVGVIFVLLVWLSVYLVYHFKFLAAATGVGAVVDIAESV